MKTHQSVDPEVSSADQEGVAPSEPPRLDFTPRKTINGQPVSKVEPNGLIVVVEDMKTCVHN